MGKLLLIIALLLCSFSPSAQNYLDLAKFDFANGGKPQFDSSNASTKLSEINADLYIPLVINNKLTILTGAAYERTSASFNPGRENENLTGLTLKLGINQVYSERWSATFLLLPKISSDFKEVAVADYQFGGAVLFKNTKSNWLNYKFGFYANGEKFGTFLVPLFGFYYQSMDKKLELKALLPLSGDINYAIGKKLKLGLNFKGQFRSYNLNTAVNQEESRYLARSTKDLYGYFQLTLEKGCNLQLGLGRSIGRSYRIYSEKVDFALPLIYFGDDRKQLNQDFTDSWLVKIGAFYRLKI